MSVVGQNPDRNSSGTPSEDVLGYGQQNLQAASTENRSSALCKSESRKPLEFENKRNTAEWIRLSSKAKEKSAN